MALDLSKFLARFVEEAREHVVRLNEGLVHLERRPDDVETMNAVFRSAHTIKGSSRMMKLAAITEVAHKLEDALGALREKKIGQSKELSDALFKGIDCIAGMIETIAAGGALNADTSALCEELSKAAQGRLSAPRSALSGSVAEAVPRASHPDEAGQGAAAALQETKPLQESIRVNAEKLDELIRLMGEIISHQNRLKHRLAEVREAEKTAKKALELASALDLDGARRDGTGREIIETAGVLHRRLKQLVSHMRDNATLQELLTAELQEKALMLRIVPLSTVFDSLHRMVPYVARAKGKDVEFIIQGGDIGLDKKMIEKIGDPLVHMLRNAVDHGIESPEERRKAGKPEQGTIRLSACYDAGSVLIELGDDGAGISPDKIREKALRKKLFSEDELDGLTEPELTELIFLPGFSTSAIITDLSGRGVGMDVVKRNIVDELKGSIKIETKAGKGARFSLRLPMTLAVMRVLLVEASGMTVAITAHYVTEIKRIPATELINVLRKKAIRLREELIPVARLGTLLKPGADTGAEKSDLLLLIVCVGTEKLGLIVDALLDEEDVVIKSLPGHMKNVRLVSGVTISDRNEILNIVHVPGLIKAAAVMKEARAPEPERAASARILVVDDSINTREIEKSILEAYGYGVDLAEDGLDAMEKTRDMRYDLVITDVEMPRLDGFSLTERLRRDEGYKDTPIIIVTSREKEEDKKRGILVGANAYIVKGAFDQTSLLETVQNLIG